MAKFSSLIEGHELADPAEDFKQAARVEQYRVSSKAIYVPAGFSVEAHADILGSEPGTLFMATGNSASSFCLALARALHGYSAVVMTPDGAQLLGVDKADSLDKMLAVIQNRV